MNNTQVALLELLKFSLFGITPEIPDNTDWNAVLDEAKAQTVVSLASDAVPKEFSAIWEVSAAQSEAHFMRVIYEQTALVNLMNSAEIPFVIIKGTAAAIYYPKPSRRTMGDIDILVSEESFEKAFSLLSENGYEFEHDFGDDREYAFCKGGILFELHKRYSDKEYSIEEYLAYGIKNARTVSICGNYFPALPEAENGLLLLDHIRHHLFGGLGIRQIIDFMMFVNSIGDSEVFEKEYLPVFDNVGLGVLARIVIKMCKKYFGLQASASWCYTADDRTCDELLETVVSSGNFGRKSPYEYRPMQSLTMGIKKNGLFNSLQKAGLANCDVFEKYRFLRPFAWIYQIFRYMKRGITAILKGEKLSSDISSGKARSDFYDRLGIK